MEETVNQKETGYPDQAETQPAQAQYSQQPIYATAVLTPGVIQNMIHDDSPVFIGEEFWEFLGVEIPISDIRDHDFLTVLRLVNKRFYNILEKYPEEEWDQIQVVEYKNKVSQREKIVNEEKIVTREVERVPIRAFNLLELWDALETKVRFKMYRAREGFTLDRLTTSRSFVKEESNIPVAGYPVPGQPYQTGEKKGWRPW